jgi:hypothetical protein
MVADLLGMLASTDAVRLADEQAMPASSRKT